MDLATVHSLTMYISHYVPLLSIIPIKSPCVLQTPTMPASTSATALSTTDHHQTPIANTMPAMQI